MVERVPNQHCHAVEVNIVLREADDLRPPEPEGDCKKVPAVVFGLDVEGLDEAADLSRLEGPLLLGVARRRGHLLTGVLGNHAVLQQVFHEKADNMVEQVKVRAARGLADLRVALAHGGVHVLQRLGLDCGDLGVAYVAACRPEEVLVGLVRVGSEVARGEAAGHEVLRALLERGARANVDPVVLYLGDELSQRRLGLGVGAGEAARAGLVLARPGVHAHAGAQLPLATLALGLVLLELNDGALALDLCHVTSPA